MSAGTSRGGGGKPVAKVILVGEYGVGKSSIFRRFVHNDFTLSTDRRSTLGFDHYEKTYNIQSRSIVLQLWDTGGLERVASVTTSYFKHADAAVLVFGYESYDSFNALSHHLIEVVASANDNAKLFLCGNKADLISQGMGPGDADVENFKRENQLSHDENLFTNVYKISCKTGEGVHEMMTDVAAHMVRSLRPAPLPIDHFRLKSTDSPDKLNNSSCCSTE